MTNAGPTGAGNARVVILDDETSVLVSVSTVLRRSGYQPFPYASTRDALAALEAMDGNVDLVLADLRMPELDGFSLLELVRRRWPGLPVVIMTADHDVRTAVEVMRLGARDFLCKPFQGGAEISATVARVLDGVRLSEGPALNHPGPTSSEPFENMVGRSPALLRTFTLIAAAAPTDAPVLLLGESGTGKELAGRAIHARSARADRPFLAVNCSVMTDTLLESELFGHVRGSFTGASSGRTGLFEEASDGTLFLDEIGDITPRFQVSLLRALQEGEIKPVGSSVTKKVKTRVIAATNRDLLAAVKAGTFRADLYYRLNVLPIELPPLRDRHVDIAPLAAHFIGRYAERYQRPGLRLSTDALAALQSYRWPGNIRELENAIQRAIIVATGQEITLADLPHELRELRISPLPAHAWDQSFAEAKRATVDAFERAYVLGLMTRTGGNVARCARLAGMDRANFRRLARQLQLDPTQFRFD